MALTLTLITLALLVIKPSAALPRTSSKENDSEATEISQVVPTSSAYKSESSTAHWRNNQSEYSTPSPVNPAGPYFNIHRTMEKAKVKLLHLNQKEESLKKEAKQVKEEKMNELKQIAEVELRSLEIQLIAMKQQEDAKIRQAENYVATLKNQMREKVKAMEKKINSFEEEQKNNSRKLDDEMYALKAKEEAAIRGAEGDLKLLKENVDSVKLALDEVLRIKLKRDFSALLEMPE